MSNRFSFFRLSGLVFKEFTQFKRDHSTFAMVISLPIVQLIIFGLAVNVNPKYLPSALINSDSGSFSRTLVQGLENTEYFKFTHLPPSEKEAQKLFAEHQVLFTLNIPSDFSRQLIRGERPQALLEVDGTDPISVGFAISASNGLMNSVFTHDLVGPLESLQPGPPPAELRTHVKYNPSSITQYNLVPGLLGVILTITFVMVASMALTREREHGTMESLLATPILPIEVIIGKAVPFIIVGYLQSLLVIVLAITFFKIPLVGSGLLLLVMILPFVLANLSVGIMISTLSRTQLEAIQISIFFFLPSMMLSGFAFPFMGMPAWAQWIGAVLPMTHFINITRGIMLKGNGFTEIWLDLWPILLFLLVTFAIAVKRYRRTLD